MDFLRNFVEMKVDKCLLCLFVIVCASSGANGNLAVQIAETTQLCCNRGSTFARNHSRAECSTLEPPEVPAYAASMCVFVMNQCCTEYYQKKKDCDTGVVLGATSKNCQSTTSSEAMRGCCEKCLEGQEAGRSRGEEWCFQRVSGQGAEDLLSNDAFNQCCMKAAKIQPTAPPPPRSPPSVVSRSADLVASMCEEYAPNELCAHHCIPVPGSYKCECNPGYMLMADKKNCKEISKDRCKPRNHCHHKCIDTGVQVKCSCRRGYKLMSDGRSCEDINECLLSPPMCTADTDCHNVQGSYKCIPKKTEKIGKSTCPPGYTKNLVNNVCDDINECKLPNPPCAAYLCENTVGGYKCGGVRGDPVNLLPSNRRSNPTRAVEDRCPPGFRAGVNEECEDVDECRVGSDDCNHQSQFCINTRGYFHCQDKGSKHCPPGFKINTNTGRCEDINECEDGQDVCKINQICVNVPGEYDCRPADAAVDRMRTCPDGMRLIPGTGTCQDINECMEGTHMCDQFQSCLNTNGSHECRCRLGFQLDLTTGACVDINECATNQHNCIPMSQRCDNTVGSFLCIRFIPCGTGYILHHSKSTCEDIDECALGTDNCASASANFHCENMPGSFRCVRNVVTSSTAAPEYEYEYYDSSEEEDDSKKNVTTSTTTTTRSPPPEPSPETVSEENLPASSSSTESPSSSRIPEETPKIPDYPRREPEKYPELEQPARPSPTYPQPEEPLYSATHERENPRIPTEPSQIPEEYPRLATQDANTEKEIPKEPSKPSSSASSTYYYEPKEPSSETPTTKDEKEEDEESNTIETETSSSENPSSTPHVKNIGTVFVNPGEETAIVTGEKEEDGSVVVDTGSIPKNTWTKIKENPCQKGYELDEYGACLDIDECATAQHSCSGLTESCRNTLGAYVCDCATSFRRDLFTNACVMTSTSTSTSTTTVTPTTRSTQPPISEITTPRANKTFWGYPEISTNNLRPFRPRSMCDIGFNYNTRTGKCDDVNECTNGQASCAAEEICVNSIGGFRCDCQPNWVLDEVRHRCMPPRNPGQLPPGYENRPAYHPTEKDQDQEQDNMIVTPQIAQIGNGASVSKCPWGYKVSDDGNCEDIDECATGEAQCGPQQLCSNLAGGYTCRCPPGHQLSADHRCRDVDECQAAGDVPLCSQNADCINTVGSYQCRCHQGFRPAPVNDKVCVDVDECSVSGTKLCQHKCNNHWGGYRCTCHRGYRINADNRTCSDIDECSEFKNKIICVGRCLNEPGSYRCTCPSGYRLSEDRKSCIDINECETGEAPCSSTSAYNGTSDVCLNTRGGYKCFQISCPPGYKLESRHRCTKIERVCRPMDYECAHQPTTYSYNYITFVSKLYIPASKVDLFTMRGPAWPHARMRFELRLTQATAPPHVRRKADINAFLLVQTGNQAVMSLVESLEGPQSIELELSMDLYSGEQFGGTAVAKLFIYVSEYEF